MRRYLPPAYTLCLSLLALTGSLFAQGFKPADGANAKQFLGKWQGRFQGKVFVTLDLTADAHKLDGTISSANIEVDNNGELTKAEAGDGSSTVTSAVVNGNRLHLTTKSTDGSEESLESEVVLVGANQAELRLIVPPDVPADVPRPKPWKLTRVPQS